MHAVSCGILIGKAAGCRIYNDGKGVKVSYIFFSKLCDCLFQRGVVLLYGGVAGKSGAGCNGRNSGNNNIAVRANCLDFSDFRGVLLCVFVCTQQVDVIHAH